MKSMRKRLASLAAAAAHPLVPADFLDLFAPLRAGAAEGNQLRGRIERVIPETRDAATLVIRPGRDWTGHVPGQYLRIGIDIDGVRQWRAYSLTHGPRADGLISITVKAVPDGLVSHHLVHRARPGTLVHLEQAAGDFVLPPEGGKFLFVTAGSGVTPVIGILRNLFPVADSGAVAVFVNYTPSPEARYPVAINQIYAATKWVAENGAQIGVDGKRLAIAGNSVGGNMATVVALMAKAHGTPALRAQVLFWPVTNASFENASYDEFAQGHFLTKPMMQWFWNAYTADPVQRQEIYASPLLATPDQLKGLPPTLVITAEKDVLRDEGEAYARKLDAAGVDVTATRYNGMIHDFGLLNALAGVPATRAALHQASEELKARLK